MKQKYTDVSRGGAAKVAVFDTCSKSLPLIYADTSEYYNAVPHGLVYDDGYMRCSHVFLMHTTDY